MNRTTVSRQAIASVVLVAAGLGMATIPAAAQDGTGAVTGTVWFDRNSDKAQNAGEPARPYAGVHLFRDGTQVASQMADKDGAYSFTGLAAGDYRVVNISAGGYLSTTPKEVSVTVAGAAKQVNFGMKGAKLSVRPWFDKNGDGLIQSQDGNLRLDQPMLLDSSEGPAFTRSAEADGWFRFDDLPPASTYRLHAPSLADQNKAFSPTNRDSLVDPATGVSAPFALGVAQERGVGVGYMVQRADIELTGISTPGAPVVGKAFTVDAFVKNNGPGADESYVRIIMLEGVRVTGMTGMRPGADGNPNAAVGLLPKLAAGKRTTVSFTLVADHAFNAKVTVINGPATLVDPNENNNTFSSTFPVVAAGGKGGSTTPPAAQPVVAKKTGAAKAPAKQQSAEVKDLASTGASTMIPVILGSVLLAAGGTLLFVLRRRVSRR